MVIFSEKNKNREDLFKKRRKANNIDLILLKSNKSTKRKGLIICLSIIIFSIGISFLPLIQSLILINQRNNLLVDVQKHDKYLSDINTSKLKIADLNKSIEKLAKSIINIKSGSAMLSELRNIIPEYITLTQLSVINNDLEIKGIVENVNGLELINIFLIQLMDSRFIDADSVKLLSANEIERISDIQDSKFITFFIRGVIKSDFEQINKNYLSAIGSQGLFRRIELLKKNEIIK